MGLIFEILALYCALAFGLATCFSISSVRRHRREEHEEARTQVFELYR